MDPGKLDHVVAGGVPAGLSPAETLEKEGWEEAGLAPELARMAEPVGVVAYAMERPEGLRRDVLHCYDLVLPAEKITGVLVNLAHASGARVIPLRSEGAS